MVDRCQMCGQSSASVPGGVIMLEGITKMMMCRPCYKAFTLGYDMGYKAWLSKTRELAERLKEGDRGEV